MVDVNRLKICLGILSGRYDNVGALSLENLILIGWTRYYYPEKGELRLLAEEYYTEVMVALADLLNIITDVATELQTNMNQVQNDINTIETNLGI